MNYLIDDVARILANPMPRRKALKMFGRTLGGALLASLGVPRADAALTQSTCTPPTPSGRCKCGTSSGTCTNGQVICGSSANCTCCPAGRACCGTNGQPVCCPPGQCCSKSSSTCTPSHGAC